MMIKFDKIYYISSVVIKIFYIFYIIHIKARPFVFDKQINFSVSLPVFRNIFLKLKSTKFCRFLNLKEKLIIFCLIIFICLIEKEN